MELRVVTDNPATLRRGQTTQYPRLGGNHHEPPSSHQHDDCFCRIMHIVLSFRLVCFTLSLFSPGMKFYPPSCGVRRRIGAEKL